MENIITALLGIQLSRENADTLLRIIETRVSKPTPPSAETFDLIKRYSRTAADMGGSFAAMVDKVEAAAELERPAERADLDALAASTKVDLRKLAARIDALEAELTADDSDAPLPPDLMELVARSVRLEAALREAMERGDSAAIAAIRKSDTRNERLILATVRRYAKGAN